MPTTHPRPWRKDSLFGDGPRRPLDREQRARFRFLLNAHRRVHRIPPLTELVGNALVRRLGVDGQLDPAHATIAGDVGCCCRTVRRALDRLRTLGLLMWQRRLVRVGWRTAQTSNAYLLALVDVGTLPIPRPPCCDGQTVRQTPRVGFVSVQRAATTVSPQAQHEARAALARVAAQRQAVVQARLLTRGVVATA